MKLNKSILGTALMIVVLFSACSQARYGNMTRRVKADPMAKNIEKSVKVEKESKLEAIVKSDMAEEVVLDNVVLPNRTIVEEVVAEESVVSSKFAEKSTRLTDEKTEDDEVKVKTTKSIVSTNLNKLNKKPIIAKATKKLEKLKVQKTNSDSGLIKLILIIVIVLLILSLIAKLGNILPGVLGLILLVLLILWLLQMV